MPERSRSPEGPRHLAPGGELRPWWRSLDVRRLRFAIGFSLLAVPVIVLDNLPEGPERAEAVETIQPAVEEDPGTAPPEASTTSTEAEATTTTVPTTTTAPPATTTPTTEAPATRRLVAPPPTTPPPTTPPTTAPPPPPTPPPPPPGSVEAIIAAHFGPAADEAITIARCESGLNPSAHNPGGGYYGLFQLSRSHADAFARVTGRSFDSAWADANANTQYARWLYGQSGWGAWGCRHHL